MSDTGASLSSQQKRTCCLDKYLIGKIPKAWCLQPEQLGLQSLASSHHPCVGTIFVYTRAVSQSCFCSAYPMCMTAQVIGLNHNQSFRTKSPFISSKFSVFIMHCFSLLEEQQSTGRSKQYVTVFFMVGTKNELHLSAQVAVKINCTVQIHTNVSAYAHSGDQKEEKTLGFIYWSEFLLWNPGQP